MTDKYQLKQIPPTKIAFSAQNPRGESPEQIREDKTFEQLKDSVAQFGVLVPVVVHELRHGDREYILVDGERRLRAALVTNRKQIPAHIATSKDKMDELIQAFHIHMLRKQWKPVAIAKAFRRIKRELKSRQSFKNDKELLKELQARTACSDTQIEELQRAVHYPESVLDEVKDRKILWSHLVQFEQSFVEQLDRRYPELLIRLGKRTVRKVLVEKARQKVIKPARALIENIVPIVQRANTIKEKKLAEKLLEKFITDPDLTPEEVKLRYDRVYPPPKDQVELADDILKKCQLLNPMIEQVEAVQIISFPRQAKELRNGLSLLKTTLSNKLRKLNSLLK